MSYSLALSGDDDVVRKMAAGQVVNVRLQPRGVNASNQAAVFANIERAMVSLGIFRGKERLGWGADANRGLIVFRAPLSTGRYTLRGIANLVGPAMRNMPAVGTARAELVTVTGPRASGAVVTPAATPAATPSATPEAAPPADASAPPAPAPEAALPSDAGGGGGGGGGAEPEEEGFFTKKIGPVPVWAIGAGVLALGAGLVVFAMRKKPTAMQANRRRVRRNPLPPPPDEPHHQAANFPYPSEEDSLPPPPDEPYYEAVNFAAPRRFARRPGSEGYERDRHYVGITEGESIKLSDLADED